MDQYFETINRDAYAFNFYFLFAIISGSGLELKKRNSDGAATQEMDLRFSCVNNEIFLFGCEKPEDLSKLSRKSLTSIAGRSLLIHIHFNEGWRKSWALKRVKEKSFFLKIRSFDPLLPALILESLAGSMRKMSSKFLCLDLIYAPTQHMMPTAALT